MSINEFQIAALPNFLNYDLSCYYIFNSNSNTFFPSETNGTFENICPICYSPIITPSRPNQCLHAFCYKCLYLWFREKNTCPYCRTIFNRIILL